MPQQYFSDASPMAGPLRVHAEPELGVPGGLNLLGKGVSDAASAGAYMVNRSQEAKARTKHMEDERWANEQLMKETLSLAELLSSDEMVKSENIVGAIGKFAEEHGSAYSAETAPSPEAYQRFKDKFDKHINNQQVQATAVEANNRVKNGLQSINNQTQMAITSFRLMSKFSERAAISTLMNSVANERDAISKMFGEHFPELAKKLHEDLTTQAVLAAAEINPKAANTILANTASIDEQTRAQLQNQIDSAGKASDSAARYRLEADRDDVMTLALSGARKEGIPLERYLMVYPEATAKEIKRQDDLKIDAYAQANTVVDAVAPFNKEVQDSAVANLKNNKNWTGSNSALRAEVAERKVKQLQDMQNDDIRGYLDAYNPVVKQARGNAKNSETLSAYYDTILMYQGPPPSNASQIEASMHLNRPTNDRHLLGKEDAKQLGADINLSSPQEVIKKIGDILGPYTKEEHQAIILNDLVTMGKLSQQYQLVWQNKDAWWIGTYIGALKAGKDIKVPDVVKTDIEKRLAINPTWKSFQSSMIGDNFQRAGEIGGFFEGISQFAGVMYATQGKSAKDAVDEATKRLITETMGFTRVNDKPLMILKDRGPGKPKRTAQEIEDIGRRLAFVPQFIPLDEINQDNWVALTPDMSEEARLEAMSDELSARSFWQVTQNGQGATLYAIDESGLQQFEVRDKSPNGGKPFVVKFDELPAFTPIREPGEMKSPVGYWSVPGTISAGIAAAKHPGITSSNKQGRPSWLKDK